jgi:hypothetical protein
MRSSTLLYIVRSENPSSSLFEFTCANNHGPLRVGHPQEGQDYDGHGPFQSGFKNTLYVFLQSLFGAMSVRRSHALRIWTRLSHACASCNAWSRSMRFSLAPCYACKPIPGTGAPKGHILALSYNWSTLWNMQPWWPGYVDGRVRDCGQ